MIDMPASQRHEVARATGLHEQYLYQCLTRRRTLPAEHAPAIERATRGQVTVEQLRDDVAWHRIPDEHWPHPLGRPCIDVAAPATQPAEARDAA
jgi:hypothetical protein